MEIIFCNKGFPFNPNYTGTNEDPEIEFTDDGRFSIDLTDEVIIENGKTLLMNDGVQVGKDWIKHLDRVKIVSLSISSFKRLLLLLKIDKYEAKEIERIRKVENKRVSTSIHRKKLAKETISKLEKEKSELVLKKLQLLKEIEYFKSNFYIV